MQRKTERPFWTVRLPPSVEELPRLKDEKLGRQLYACIKLDTASDAGVLHLGELLDRNAEEQDGNGKRYIDVPFGEGRKDLHESSNRVVEVANAAPQLRDRWHSEHLGL